MTDALTNILGYGISISALVALVFALWHRRVIWALLSAGTALLTVFLVLRVLQMQALLAYNGGFTSFDSSDTTTGVGRFRYSLMPAWGGHSEFFYSTPGVLAVVAFSAAGVLAFLSWRMKRDDRVRLQPVKHESSIDQTLVEQQR